MLTEVLEEKKAVSRRENSIFWKQLMALGGMSLGVLLMFAASVSWCFSAFENVNHDHFELILIAAAFVFMGIGAHGLDLIRDAELAERKRKLGL